MSHASFHVEILLGYVYREVLGCSCILGKGSEGKPLPSVRGKYDI